MEVKVFPLETLRQFSTRVFRHFGIPEASCRCTGLRRLARLDSRGVARLHTHFDMHSLRRINPTPEIRVVRSTLSTATTVDGDNGLVIPVVYRRARRELPPGC
jgi:L-2-hydroxycarboxylate dehydrogenase (NAD+)